MAKGTDKKIIGVTSLEDALSQFAAKNKENKKVLDTSIMIRNLMEKLVQERMFLGMTQRDLANETGIKQPMIARIEKMESIPRLDTFLWIADKLDFDVTLVYRESFSRIDFKMKKIFYSSASTNDATYEENQMSYGGCSNGQITTAA